MRPSPVDPHALFREIALLFSQRMVKPGVDFRYQPVGKLPPCIVTDPKGIRQVCLNLITNALKFTEEGFVALRVSCKQLDDGNAQLNIAVYDSGIGMTEAEQAVIFNAFEQTRHGASQIGEGFGLGLYICKNIVSLLGGSIEVESQPGKGSRFQVVLPVGLAVNPTDSEPVPPRSDLRLGAANQRVLIVDDIDSNRMLLRRLLHDTGLELHEAASADAALACIQALQPDLVLMDIRMPGKGGDTAISEIRRLPGCSTLPIIAVTANAMEGERERLLELGATDFISKPFRREEIIRRLAGILQLPLHEEPVVPAAAAPKEPPAPTPVTTLQSALSILVIDDNQANLQLLSSQLRALGLRAEEAASAVPEGSRTRVIAITGSPEEYERRCLAAGMDQVLGKPLLLETLRQTLQQGAGEPPKR